MLKTKVKAGAITNLTDARYFAAWEVHWLGFALDPADEAQIDPATARAIREWVDGVEIVGEFGLQSPAEIRSIAEAVGLDTLQLGPFAPPADCEALDGYRLIKEIVPEPGSDLAGLRAQLAPFAGKVGHFLLSLDKAGADWPTLQSGRQPLGPADLRQLCEEFPVILALPCPAGQLEELLARIRPAAIGLRGGEEEKVGYKSFDELDELFELLAIEV